jgi:hypothetical protein
MIIYEHFNHIDVIKYNHPQIYGQVKCLLNSKIQKS